MRPASIVAGPRTNSINTGRYVSLTGLCVVLITVPFFNSLAEDKTGAPSILENLPIEFEKKFHKIQARNQQWDINQLMDLLGIRPKMTILDIGTGVGTNAFKFAEKMKGTGKVYATDIDKQMIKYVKEETRKRGVKNVIPVVVKRDGWDPFYGKHKYDLILAFHVDSFIKNKEEYFARFRDYFKEGGRIVILRQARLSEPFSIDDIEDIPGFIHELATEPLQSPYFALLRPKIQEGIMRYKNGQIEEAQELAKEIPLDLNSMKGTVDLFRYQFRKLKDDPLTMFMPVEEAVFKFLIETLHDKRILGNGPYSLNKADEASVVKLNTLLLVRKLRKYLKEGNNFFLPPRSFYEGRSFIVKFMDQAGYRLLEVYDSLGFMEVAMVFVPQKE